MSLRAREIQALSDIADGLTSSDPKLGSLLTAFSRKAWGEDMPPHEKIRRIWPRQRRIRTSHTGPARRLLRTGSRPGPPRRVLVLWAALSATLIAIALIVIHSSSGACTQWRANACAPMYMTGTRPYAPMPHG